MTPEEYKAEKKRLEKELDEKITQLMRKCAIENNPYKKGDIISDNIR